MARPPSVSMTCAHCAKPFTVPHGRAMTAKFCSRACSDLRPREKHMIRCRECGSAFALKKSQAVRNTAWGNFCGQLCISVFRSRVSAGAGNPNWRGRNFDSDGYRLMTPQASLSLGLGRMKVHHAVALTAVGLEKIPVGMHIHHRDCDRLENEPANLQFLTASDHKWLHQQFGVAVLRAITRGQIAVDQAADWSDDPARATGLLLGSVESQAALMRYMTEKFGSADIGVISAMRPVRFDIKDITTN